MKILILFILILIIPVISAHDGVDHDTSEQAQEHLDAQGSINPFSYFSSGHIMGGLIAIGIWILAIMALGILAFVVLARLF